MSKISIFLSSDEKYDFALANLIIGLKRYNEHLIDKIYIMYDSIDENTLAKIQSIYSEAIEFIRYSDEDFSRDVRRSSYIKEHQFLKNYSKFAFAKFYLFDLLEKFAGYGFNKSHSVSYSMITTRMAYLKLKYPQEFYVALLQTTNNSNDTKFKKFVSEINTLNIKIKLPNINVSEKMFVVEDNSMVMPLTSIKGITSDTVNKILFERKQNGPFSSLTSFMVRTNEYGLNKTQVEKLIKSGCFDIFTSNRQSMLDKLDICIQYANVKSKQQLSLNFTTEDDIVFDSNTYEDKAQKIADECELLGIPISDNPVIYQKNIAKTKYKNIILSFIDDIKLNSEAFILVFVNRKRVYSSNKSNKTTVFLNVFDEKGTMLDCTMFNETYNLYGELIKENETVILQGKMNLRNNSKSFIINKVFSLKENSKKENLKEDNDVQISNN